ncbi:MAG TPA: hypothetical protein PK821_04605 [Victivallales bacterium]|nr:hypothetical protein [Victivallales bacterium]
MKLKYPSKFILNVIKNEASGVRAEKIDIVVPTIVRPKQEFSIKISVTDEIGLPAISFHESVELTLEPVGTKIPVKVVFFR